MHHYGVPRASDNLFTCPNSVDDGQRFLRVLTSEDFGPADGYSPNAGANPGSAPLERITSVRTLGTIDLWTPQAIGIDPIRLPQRLMAALCRLDDGAVWDVNHQFPSLFVETGFARDERVLQMWEPSVTPANGVVEQGEQHLNVHRARVEWDLKVPMKLETGEGLWLLLECGSCDETIINYDLLWNYWGFSRTLFRE